jgi:hypothetical protein
MEFIALILAIVGGVTAFIVSKPRQFEKLYATCGWPALCGMTLLSGVLLGQMLDSLPEQITEAISVTLSCLAVAMLTAVVVRTALPDRD